MSVNKNVSYSDYLDLNDYLDEMGYVQNDLNSDPEPFYGVNILGEYLGRFYSKFISINLRAYFQANNVLFNNNVKELILNSYLRIYCSYPDFYNVFLATKNNQDEILNHCSVTSVVSTEDGFIEISYNDILSAGQYLNDFDYGSFNIYIAPSSGNFMDCLDDSYFELIINKTVEITTIKVQKSPNKLIYGINESFDHSGIEIIGIFSDTILDNFGFGSVLLNTTEFTIETNNFSNTTDILEVHLNGDTNIKTYIGLGHTIRYNYNFNSSIHYFDIYYPNNTSLSNLPIVITIHGGSWSKESDPNTPENYQLRNNYKDNVEYIKSCGAICVCLEYRVFGYYVLNNSVNFLNCADYYANSVIDMLDDIDSAIYHLVSNYTSKINANKIFLMGYSSGAHISLLFVTTRTCIGYSIAGVFSEAGPTLIPESTTDPFLIKLKTNLTASDVSPLSQIQNLFNTSIKFVLAYSQIDEIVSYNINCLNFYSALGDNNLYRKQFVFSNKYHGDLSNITYLYKTGNQTAIAYYEEIYDVINS